MNLRVRLVFSASTYFLLLVWLFIGIYYISYGCLQATWYEVVKKRSGTTIQGRLRHKYYALRKLLISALLIPKRHVQEDLEEEEGLDIGEWDRHMQFEKSWQFPFKLGLTMNWQLEMWSCFETLFWGGVNNPTLHCFH